MQYTVLDTETEMVVGPFESFEEATHFIDEVCKEKEVDLYIEPLYDPQDWYNDNIAEVHPHPAQA